MLWLTFFYKAKKNHYGYFAIFLRTYFSSYIVRESMSKFVILITNVMKTCSNEEIFCTLEISVVQEFEG